MTMTRPMTNAAPAAPATRVRGAPKLDTSASITERLEELRRRLPVAETELATTRQARGEAAAARQTEEAARLRRLSVSQAEDVEELREGIAYLERELEQVSAREEEAALVAAQVRLDEASAAADAELVTLEATVQEAITRVFAVVERSDAVTATARGAYRRVQELQGVDKGRMSTYEPSPFSGDARGGRDSRSRLGALQFLLMQMQEYRRYFPAAYAAPYADDTEPPPHAA